MSLLSPLLSLPLKPISAVHPLSFGIIASLFAIVLSCLIPLHKDFKLAKTFAPWAHSAAAMSRSRHTTWCWCWWLRRKKQEMVGAVVRPIHAKPLLYNREGRAERSPVFLLPSWSSHCLCQAPTGRLRSYWAYDCRNKNSEKIRQNNKRCALKFNDLLPMGLNSQVREEPNFFVSFYSLCPRVIGD